METATDIYFCKRKEKKIHNGVSLFKNKKNKQINERLITLVKRKMTNFQDDITLSALTNIHLLTLLLFNGKLRKHKV